MNTSGLSNPGISTPGVSLLNPDIQLAGQKEDEESEEEELEKQKELQEVLSTEFNHLSFGEEDEKENEENQSEVDQLHIYNQLKSRTPWPMLSGWNSQGIVTKTSTPINQNEVPALQTPILNGSLENGGIKVTQPAFIYASPKQRFLPAGEEFISSNRRQVLGNENDLIQQVSDQNQWLEDNSQIFQENWEREDDEKNTLTQRGEIDGGNEEFGEHYASFSKFSEPIPFRTPMQRDFTGFFSNIKEKQEEVYQEEVLQNSSDYRVQYISSNYSNKDDNEMLSDRETENFLQTAGTTEERLQTQMQILHNAREHNLKEQIQQDEIFKQEKEKEIRILEHNLKLMEAEKLAVTSDLSYAKEMLKDCQQENGKLQGTVLALQTQIRSLTDTKEELNRNLLLLESTNKSLNQQLQEFQRSDNLVRTREQHEMIVRSLKQKHQQEINEIAKKFEDVMKELYEKTELNEKLMKKLSEESKRNEKDLLEKSETISKLNHSLEESQQQCQKLLLSDSIQNVGQLNLEIHHITEAKNISENLCKSLQKELSELKEHLNIYESAAALGDIPGIADPSIESMMKLKIKKALDWISPASTHSVSRPLSSEEINGLKRELQYCLNNCKKKREQNDTLQTELNLVRIEANEAKLQQNKAEDLAKDFEAKVHSLQQELMNVNSDLASYKNGDIEQKHAQEIKHLKTENKDLLKKLQEHQDRFEEVSSEVENLNENIRSLNQQMVQIVHECDEDKRIALEKCEEAYLNHHSYLKEKLLSDMEEEKTNLIENWNKYIKDLQDQLQNVQKELDKTKEDYIAVCKEKNNLEDKLNKEWENKVIQMKSLWSQEMKDLKEMCEASKNMKVLADKQKFVMDSRGQNEKINWLKEMEKAKHEAVQETEKQLENQIEEIILTCLDKEHEKWMKKDDITMKAKLEKEKQELQNKKQENMEQQLKKSFVEEYEEKLKNEMERIIGKFSDENLCKIRLEEITFLKENVKSLTFERDQIKQKLITLQDNWSVERSELLQKKDLELKIAVKAVEEEICQATKNNLDVIVENLQKMHHLEKLKLEEQINTLNDKIKELDLNQKSLEKVISPKTHKKILEEEWKKRLIAKESEWLAEKKQLQKQYEHDTKLQDCEKDFAVLLESLMEKVKLQHSQDKLAAENIFDQTVKDFKRQLEEKENLLQKLKLQLQIKQEDTDHHRILESRTAQDDFAQQLEKENMKLTTKITKYESELLTAKKQTEELKFFKEKCNQDHESFNRIQNEYIEKISSMEKELNKKNHDHVNQEHFKQMELIKKQIPKTLHNVIVQTEYNSTQNEILIKMKQEYVKTIQEVKAYANRFIHEVIQEKQMNTKHLLICCLKCLQQIFQSEHKVILKKIENVFELIEILLASRNFSLLTASEIFSKTSSTYVRVSPDDDSGLPRSCNSPDLNSGSSRYQGENAGLLNNKHLKLLKLTNHNNKEKFPQQEILIKNYYQPFLPINLDPHKSSHHLHETNASGKILDIRFPNESRQYNPETKQPFQYANNESNQKHVTKATFGTTLIPDNELNFLNGDYTLDNLSESSQWFSLNHLPTNCETKEVFKPIRSEACFSINPTTLSHQADNSHFNSLQIYRKPKPLVSRETQAPTPPIS